MMGFGEILFLVCTIILFFSARRLPDIVHSVRKIAKGFKEGVSGEEIRPSREVKDLNGETKPPPSNTPGA